jgi:hypothetical protein
VDIQPETEKEQRETVPPDNLAAAAEDCSRLAAESRERASRIRDDAQNRLAAAEQEAARLVSEGRADLLASGAEATAADGEAAGLEARARSLAVAGAERASAEQADQRVHDLEAERARLGAAAAEAAARLGQLDAERRDAEGQLAAARARGDVEAIAAARGRIGGIDDPAWLEAQQAAAQDRLAAIGDGGDIGDLAEARGTASRHHQAVRVILNDLWPDRPEAVRDRALAELRGALTGNLQRIAEVADAPEPRRNVIVR